MGLPILKILGGALKLGGSLLFGKVSKATGESEGIVEKILGSAGEIISKDKEFQKFMANYEVEVFGRYVDLHPKAKLLVGVTRPILSFGLAGLFFLGIVIRYIQYILWYFWNIGTGDLLVIPPELVGLTKWVCAFWFTSRGVEKIVDKIMKVIKKGKKESDEG